MSDNTIQLSIEATDNASSVIAGASAKIAGSLKLVEAAQTDLSGAVDQSIAPLSASEEAQMANVQATLQIKDAQTLVQTKQEELNVAIRTYGVNSEEAAAKLRELNSAQEALAASQTQVEESTKRASINYKDLTIGVAGVATASFALYNAYDNVADMGVQVDRANLMVKASANSVEDAQKRVNKAVSDFGPNSAEAKAAQADLALAQERYGLATERAGMMQGNYNETIVRSALSVIPSLITMTASLSSFKGILTASTVAATAATATEGAVNAAAVAPTFSLTGAVAALNAVLLANPIILVIAAVAALVAGLIYAYSACKPFKDAVDAIGSALWTVLKPAVEAVYNALKWLWDNILKPLAEFLGGTFLAYWDLVGKALGVLVSAIGAAWSWLGDQWAKLTGTFGQRVREGMDSALSAVDEGLSKLTDEVNKKYDEMVATVETAYQDETDAAIKSWEDRLSQEVAGWDKVLKTANDNYDKLVDEVKSKLGDQTNAIDDGYQDQLDSMKSAYQDQLDAINAFYDAVIATTDSKLKGIQSAREDDLNSLELTYLMQKEAIENAVAAQKISQEEGQTQLETLDKAYNNRRGSISQDYRIQELQAEIADKANKEKAESERKAALEKAKKDETAMEVYLLNDKNKQIAQAEKASNLEIQKINQDRNKIIAEITADRDRIENKHTEDLKNIYQNRESELNAITQRAADARLRIVQDANSRIEAENKRLGNPSTANPSPQPGPSPGTAYRNPATGAWVTVPPLAEGGIVTQPTLALIGEAGPEAVVPLNKFGATETGPTTQYNTFYVTIPIGNITQEVPLEYVKEAVADGLVAGILRRVPQ